MTPHRDGGEQMGTMVQDTRYSVDVLLADGAVATIRTLRPEDRAGVQALFDRASDDSLYSRFFALNRHLADGYVSGLFADVRRLAGAVIAEHDDRVLGIAAADAAGPGVAEVSMLVDDAAQGRGVGTLLLEHLAALQRHDGVRRLVAEVLGGNHAMLGVFRATGFALTHRSGGGVVSLEMDTESTARAVMAADARERTAEARSLRWVLGPRSVAVVGAGRMRGGVGREVLENLRAGGFRGSLVAVHPSAREIGGIPAYPSLDDVATPVDLVVVAVPAVKVLDVVEQAAHIGARGAVVLSSGFGEAGPAGVDRQQDLVRAARHGGLRVIGPNCLGILSTVPDRCNATFAGVDPAAGGLAVASQSGGVGIAVLDAAARADLGVRSFVSLGNKADVSGNDLLAAWADDPTVDVAALYLESFGNPVKFARLARYFSEQKPLLAVVGGRSPVGGRAGASHTAAAAAPATSVKAMFSHAGVIEVSGIPDLVDTARLLTTQPLPGGLRLGICGNAGGVGVLAADEAYDSGLQVPELPDDVRRRLRSVAGPAASVHNPLDLGAGASPTGFADAISLMLDCDDVDSLLVVIAATRVADPAELLPSVAEAASLDPAKPVAVVLLGMPDSPTVVGEPGVPIFGSTDAAVAALGHAARYGVWRAAPRGTETPPSPLAVDRAQQVVAQALIERPAGGWLSPERARGLLEPFGVELVSGLVARSTDEAVRCAQAIGFPVVVKAASPGVVHKTDQGLVATGLHDDDEVRDAVARFQATLMDTTTPVLIQPQVPHGVELLVGGYRDPTFGPLVMVGAGGVETEIAADRSFLLPPVTDVDAAASLRSLRAWPLLAGFRGASPADHRAVERIVQSVARLLQDVPEVTELDLNPVIVHPCGVSCVDAKIRLAPAPKLVDDSAAPSLKSVVASSRAGRHRTEADHQ
jgi:acyl-CoA synthetase (NDP forming)/GNAT superfamily N-acetyltransferase